jgi:hypothetical protein
MSARLPIGSLCILGPAGAPAEVNHHLSGTRQLEILANRPLHGEGVLPKRRDLAAQLLDLPTHSIDTAPSGSQIAAQVDPGPEAGPLIDRAAPPTVIATRIGTSR